MRFNVVTIFPQLITDALKEGIVSQAFKGGQLAVKTVNPRDFATDNHKTVDDRPFGGGDGMVLMIEPLMKAIESLGDERGRVVYLTPQGRKWTDSLAREWAADDRNLTLICGRYAGVDQRVINRYVDEEVSIGDYVLSGGEIPALVLIDSISRLRPGVLGNAESPQKDSFVEGLLEGPVFTRPREHELGAVPSFLMSGNHQEIAAVRKALATVLTGLRRPDLFASSPEMKKMIKKLRQIPASDLKQLGVDEAELSVLEAKA